MEWTCPVPLRDYPTIVMGHGAGGQLSAELIEHLFLPAFRNPALEALADAAVLPPPGGPLVFSTDAFVVRPLFFPGGSVGELAVNGTVNDLAMAGAVPLYLSAAFILEEGLPLETLGRVVDRMAEAARRAGVQIVTGDTKVVERGHGDGCFIATTGVGVLRKGVDLSPAAVRPGDVILCSGYVGDHGMAVMSVREGLEFDTPLQSDCQPLHTLAAAILEDPGPVRVLRDPTRGGLASALHEIARKSNVGLLVEETAIPVRPEVRAACELLGLDPLHVANEGKLIAVVAPEAADATLARMRRHPAGADAAVIGQATAAHPGVVALRTAVSATRVLDMIFGEQLPRIC
jgi:hydrogenase expression/formation protein HypE